MATIINSFLRRCLQKVADKVQPLTVVLGNEGGDMDSIVGAIYLAMLFDIHAPWDIENPIPAINFPIEDLVLRNDVAKLFQEIGLDSSLLLSVQKSADPDRFLDMAQLDASIYLHDHNKLRENQSVFDSKVVGVVDHHADEHKYTDLPARKRVIKTVGSACTIVAQLFQICEEEVPCPSLLIAPIVLDTVNFDPAQKKVTPEDVAAFEWLCRKLPGGTVDATALFQKLSQWKNDVLCLTVPEILRRDYKKFDFPCTAKKGDMATGISSVPCSCPEMEQKFTTAEVARAAVEYVEQNALDVLIFAFAGKANGVHSRDLAFCAKRPILEFFAPFIEDAPNDLVFTKISEHEVDGKAFFYLSYSLSDPAVSRKTLVPLLKDFLAGSSAKSGL